MAGSKGAPHESVGIMTDKMHPYTYEVMYIIIFIETLLLEVSYRMQCVLIVCLKISFGKLPMAYFNTSWLDLYDSFLDILVAEHISMIEAP